MYDTPTEINIDNRRHRIGHGLCDLLPIVKDSLRKTKFVYCALIPR